MNIFVDPCDELIIVYLREELSGLRIYIGSVLVNTAQRFQSGCTPSNVGEFRLLASTQRCLYHLSFPSCSLQACSLPLATLFHPEVEVNTSKKNLSI